MIYTAFCKQADDKGTVWIDTITADSLEEAKKNAIDACAADWLWQHQDLIECIGLAEGEVKILFWQDISE